MSMASFVIVEALYPGLTQLDFTGPHTVFSRVPGVETIVASRARRPDRKRRRAGLRGNEAAERNRALRPAVRPRRPRCDGCRQRSRLHGAIRAAGGGSALSHVRLHRLAHFGRRGPAEGQARGLPLGLARYAAAVRRDPGREAGGSRRQHHHRRRRHGGHRLRAGQWRRSWRAKPVAQAIQLGIEYAPRRRSTPAGRKPRRPKRSRWSMRAWRNCCRIGSRARKRRRRGCEEDPLRAPTGAAPQKKSPATLRGWRLPGRVV